MVGTQLVFKTFDTNKKWSDKFMPEIKRLCQEYIPIDIQIASPFEDKKHATDLLIPDIRIGCRVRRNKYHRRYNGQFTIRCELPSENETEIDKIMEGWGDYYFFGFSNYKDNGNGFVSWIIFNLDVFRQMYTYRFVKGIPSIRASCLINNGDGSSSFRAFVAESFPNRFVIAEKRFCVPVYKLPTKYS